MVGRAHPTQMVIDPVNFLHSMALAIATATSLKYATTPRQIFIDRAVEDANAADPYSVIRAFGGAATSWEVVPSLSIQVMTVGSSPAAALRRAMILFEALLDSDGRPRQAWTFAGKIRETGVSDGTWRVVATSLDGRPGIIGVDEKNRSQCSFNMTMSVTKS